MDYGWPHAVRVVGNPSDQLGASVLSSATNTLTAAICDITGDQPADVCSSATIQAVKGELLANGK